jgi:creatinine amidohydrolase/Fe(II)-dependent formamide hydrolase-like protein
MIEEHGPHLPVGADTLGVMYEATRVTQRLNRALAGWNVVMMPPIHYGTGGANLIGGIQVHPGRYGIRQSTVRSLVADKGRRIREKYFSPAEITSFGMDVHAGVGETSAMLALRPDLVDSGYKRLPGRVGHNFRELREIALQPGWQGYISSPDKANAAYGRAFEAWWVEGFTDLILRAIRGQNMFKLPRLPEADFGDTAMRAVLGSAIENERAFEQKLADWLERRKKN